jgi:hypothetical protein
LKNEEAEVEKHRGREHRTQQRVAQHEARAVAQFMHEMTPWHERARRFAQPR